MRSRPASAGRRLRGRLAAPGAAFALALVAGLSATGASAAAEPPRDPDALVSTIRAAIEAKDYEALRELVFWKDAGEIKRRVVRFELNRGLGRQIRSIAFEPFPANGLDAVVATGKLVPNMTITDRVRVVYDEPPVERTGKPPTAVFLVGKIDDAYRIGLVVRKPGFVDDDD